MNNLDLLALGIRNLWRRKLRTFLTVLGVVIGVTAIIVMLSFGLGMEAQNEQMLAQMGDVTTITIHQKDSYGMAYGMPMQEGQPQNLEEIPLDPAAVALVGRMPHVRFVSPVVETYVTLTQKRKQTNVQLMGFDERYVEELGIRPQEGRLFQSGETLTAVAGSWVPQNFWDPSPTNFYGMPETVDLMNSQIDLVLADWIEVTQPTPFDEPDAQPARPVAPKYPLKVVGLLGDTTWEYGNALIMPIGEVEKLKKEKDAYMKKLNESYQQDGGMGMGSRQSVNKNKYSRMLVKVDSIENVEAVQEQLKAEGFMVSSLLDMSTALAEQARGIQMVLGGIGAVSLLVAAIGIMNTMVMSIYERTKEIGVMKVIGASIANIRNMFLIEASLIGLLGGIFGVALSLAGSAVINSVVSQSGMFGGGVGMDGTVQKISIIPLWLILLALIFSIAIGVASGYYPAVRATRLSALEAMRNE